MDLTFVNSIAGLVGLTAFIWINMLIFDIIKMNGDRKAREAGRREAEKEFSRMKAEQEESRRPLEQSFKTYEGGKQS